MTGFISAVCLLQVYYFRRIETPSHLPGFLLTAKSFNKDHAEVRILSLSDFLWEVSYFFTKILHYNSSNVHVVLSWS